MLGSYLLKNFCKNFSGAIHLLILGCLWLCSCSQPVEETVDLPPDQVVNYSLFPNDGAAGDSAIAHFAHGTILYVHPNATYEISFQVGDESSIPELQLFRTFKLDDRPGELGFRRVRVLKPQVKDDRYVFTFTCEEKNSTAWVATLGAGRSYYEGNLKDFRFEGSGTYSDHFSINLIVTGLVGETPDGVKAKDLPGVIAKEFRSRHTSVTLDTVYFREAHNHPTLGFNYPKNEKWYAGITSSDVWLSELGGWPEPKLHNALDLVLVHQIGVEGVMGYSKLFSGNMGEGNGSTVVVGTTVYVDGKESAMTSHEIAQVAVHEIGHFFGLRHTTSTLEDMEVADDYSIVEDGLDDTPWCPSLNFGGILAKKKSSMNLDYVMPFIKMPKSWKSKAGIQSCPDMDNVMFPLDDDQVRDVLSPTQREIFQKNLMIFPH